MTKLKTGFFVLFLIWSYLANADVIVGTKFAVRMKTDASAPAAQYVDFVGESVYTGRVLEIVSVNPSRDRIKVKLDSFADPKWLMMSHNPTPYDAARFDYEQGTTPFMGTFLDPIYVSQPCGRVVEPGSVRFGNKWKRVCVGAETDVIPDVRQVHVFELYPPVSKLPPFQAQHAVIEEIYRTSNTFQGEEEYPDRENQGYVGFVVLNGAAGRSFQPVHALITNLGTGVFSCAFMDQDNHIDWYCADGGPECPRPFKAKYCPGSGTSKGTVTRVFRPLSVQSTVPYFGGLTFVEVENSGVRTTYYVSHGFPF